MFKITIAYIFNFSKSFHLEVLSWQFIIQTHSIYTCLYVHTTNAHNVHTYLLYDLQVNLGVVTPIFTEDILTIIP